MKIVFAKIGSHSFVLSPSKSSDGYHWQWSIRVIVEIEIIRIDIDNCVQSQIKFRFQRWMFDGIENAHTATENIHG